MDNPTKVLLLGAIETIKNFCDSTPCNNCPFDDAMFCAFDGDPCTWNVANLKARLEHEQTDTPQS